MTKIVFLDRATIGPTVSITRPKAEHSWEAFDRTPPELVAERLRGADIAITNKAPIRAEALAQLPSLKMISVAATGYDVIDVPACSERGIAVSNVRGYAINTVPEHVFALVFALRRNLIGYRDDVINGAWGKADQFCFFNHSIRDLSGARLGIIGEGVIGQAVARIGRALGMDVVFAAHKGVTGLGRLYTPWDEVLETSDVLTLHAPLTPATRNMISTTEFRAMLRRPILINTSRGGLVDEAALVEALDAGLISAAGFDVLTSEPPRPDNPLLSVLERPNVIVTPHVAWASEEAMQTLWDQTVKHIDDYLRGAPSNLVTPPRPGQSLR
jgi:glycerate dehydrogenase